MRLLDLIDYDRNAPWTPRLMTCDGPGSLPATDDDPTTRYAILSHRWQEDEVTFADVMDGSSHRRAGYDKLVGAVRIARQLGHDYLWMDTCCIDKSSSAELSEAINSMYLWYSKAQACIAYLVDVDAQAIGVDNGIRELIGRSEWFRRGWTLQELLAPEIVLFFSSTWAHIGSKSADAGAIAQITGIDQGILLGHINVHSQSIATRMSWAANRHTTREEDLAYCLMGLFSVHMALLYGERMNAFRRLQEEIMKYTDDYSLFAWRVAHSDCSDPMCSLLAESPSAFRYSKGITSYEPWQDTTPFQMTNRGLSINLHLAADEGGVQVAYLPCCHETVPYQVLRIHVMHYPGTGQWTRLEPNSLESCRLMGSKQHMYFRTQAQPASHIPLSRLPSVRECSFLLSSSELNEPGKLRLLGGLSHLHVAHDGSHHKIRPEETVFEVPVMSAGINVALLFAYKFDLVERSAYAAVYIGSMDDGEIGCAFLPHLSLNTSSRILSDSNACELVLDTIIKHSTMSMMDVYKLVPGNHSVQVPLTLGAASVNVTFSICREAHPPFLDKVRESPYHRCVTAFKIAAHARDSFSLQRNGLHLVKNAHKSRQPNQAL